MTKGFPLSVKYVALQWLSYLGLYVMACMKETAIVSCALTYVRPAIARVKIYVCTLELVNYVLIFLPNTRRKEEKCQAVSWYLR